MSIMPHDCLTKYKLSPDGIALQARLSRMREQSALVCSCGINIGESS